MINNNFANLYKTWKTDKLLDIVDNPSDYQPLAVEAARLELESRALTEDQIAKAQADQEIRRRDEINNSQKVKDIENRVKSIGTVLGNILNPIQSVPPTTDKLIKIISLFIGFLFLYQLYKEFGLLKFIVTDNSGNWGFSIFFIFFPVILLPIATFFLWGKKKIGWILSVIYFSHVCSSALSMFVIELTRKQVTLSVFDRVFSTSPSIVHLLTFLLFGGLTYTLCRRDIRVIYQIGRAPMLIALGLGITTIILMAISFA